MFSRVRMIQEKRKFHRFPSHIGFVSADTDGLSFSFVTDLSREGAFIESARLQPVGSTFRFVLSNGNFEAPVSGRVMRVKDAFFHGGKSGLGIRFDGLDRRAKILRDDLLLYLMNSRFQQMWEAA